MDNEARINELAIAIGYALDAGDERKDKKTRKEARDKCLRILMRVIKPNVVFTVDSSTPEKRVR